MLKCAVFLVPPLHFVRLCCSGIRRDWLNLHPAHCAFFLSNNITCVTLALVSPTSDVQPFSADEGRGQPHPPTLGCGLLRSQNPGRRWRWRCCCVPLTLFDAFRARLLSCKRALAAAMLCGHSVAQRQPCAAPAGSSAATWGCRSRTPGAFGARPRGPPMAKPWCDFRRACSLADMLASACGSDRPGCRATPGPQGPHRRRPAAPLGLPHLQPARPCEQHAAAHLPSPSEHCTPPCLQDRSSSSARPKRRPCRRRRGSSGVRARGVCAARGGQQHPADPRAE